MMIPCDGPKPGRTAPVLGQCKGEGGKAQPAKGVWPARRGGFGFLLRHRPSPLASSTETRWEVAAAPSRPDAFGGLGLTAFALALTKNRRGPAGLWTIAWDHHERSFQALSLSVAGTAFDRPDRMPFARAV